MDKGKDKFRICRQLNNLHNNTAAKWWRMPPMADTKAKIPSIFKLFFYVFSTFFCVIRKFNIICICSSFVCIHKIHSVIMFLFVYIFPAFGKQQMRPFACLLRSRCAHKPTMSRLISAMHGGVVMCPCPPMHGAGRHKTINKQIDRWIARCKGFKVAARLCTGLRMVYWLFRVPIPIYSRMVNASTAVLEIV